MTRKSDYSEFKSKGYPVVHKKKDLFRTRLSLPGRYRLLAGRIRDLDRELDRFVLKADDYKSIIDRTYASNIHWSVRIEGNVLPLKEVESIVSALTEGKVYEAETKHHQEIVNQLRLAFMTDDYNLPLSRYGIMEIHRELTVGVLDIEHSGYLREVEVGVYGRDGTEYFRACPAKNVEKETDKLADWLDKSPFDEIITAVIFFHEFESIHPFSDGNGRTGRELFTRILQEYGLKNCRMCRFEEEILSDTSTYYDLLSYTDDTGDYAPLIMYITESLLIAYGKAVDEFRSMDQMGHLDASQRFLVEEARKAKYFTLKDASKWAPEVGEQTLRSRLANLVDIGLLEKNGATRGLIYVFADGYGRMKRSLKPQSVKVPERRFTKTRSAASVSRS